MKRLIKRLLEHAGISVTRIRGQEVKAFPSSHEEYLKLQLVDGLSFETDDARWANGQRLYIQKIAQEIPRKGLVIDCACGEGIGLMELRALGFTELLGIELQTEKARRARSQGFEILEIDMHDLEKLNSKSVSAILTSHTLEHAINPDRVIREFHRVLRPGGYMHVVLPFPDTGLANQHIHVGKYILGTHVPKGEELVISFFTSRGFVLNSYTTDDYREPEIWISLTKSSNLGAES